MDQDDDFSNVGLFPQQSKASKCVEVKKNWKTDVIMDSSLFQHSLPVLL